MTDEAKRRFFQFPLGLLACGATQEEKLDLMIAWATINAGLLAEERLGGKQQAQQKLCGISCEVFNLERHDHRAWGLGKEIVGYSWQHSPYPCVKLYERAKAFLRQFGKSPFVRISEGVMIDVVSRTFPFRDFAVLAAVYAVIGDKPFAIVRRDRVRAGALGYSSAKVIFDQRGELTQAGKAILSTREDKAQPLSLNQCRYTLNRLHARKFFSRLQANKNGRTVYYSRSASHEALADLLLIRLGKKRAAALAQAKAERRYREEAPPILKRLMSGETTASGGTNSPDTHLNDTAPPTAAATALIPAPNNCSLNADTPNQGEAKVCDANVDDSPAGRASHPNVKRPTLPEIESFFESLRSGGGSHALQWFQEHGEDSRWSTKDWHTPASKWLFDRLRRSP